VHVVTPVARAGAAGETERSEEAGPVHVHRVYLAEPDMPEAQFALRRVLERLDAEVRFDLWHGFFLTAAYPCVILGGRPGRTRPVIASIRGSDVAMLLDLPFARAVLLPVLRKATWITSINDAYLLRVAEEVGIHNRSSVIRNSVSAELTPAGRWKPTPDTRGVVGTIGKFRKVKDIPLLVRAYAALPKAARRRLLLAGSWDDDEERAWSETLIAEFGIADDVEVTGAFPHEALPDVLSRLHVYVQSSADEGLPNALLEAAAFGVPLVATAVGGMREVLTDRDTGLLVPHGDPRALAAAIGEVLADDGLAARLSEGARRLAAEWSPERERDDWLRLYARLIALHPPG
jgi:glycosyltransferase involved in cell wall biosynthesis